MLPSQGAAFAYPLEDGRFAICRVLLDQTSEQSKQWGSRPILAANSAWIGDAIPNTGVAALRPILRLNHHSWEDEPSVLWIADEPPKEFVYVGQIRPTAQEKRISCASFGNWRSLTIQPLIQWRWDNDRDVLLAEDRIKEREEALARQNARRERLGCLGRVSLNDLREHTFFKTWQNYPPREAIEASRNIMARAVRQLIELGPNASENERLSVLQECIESFNELDSEKSYIETDEREDICNEFEAIVFASGLGHLEYLADRWREW
jgi:hypothetical protein